mgnify:FL=1
MGYEKIKLESLKSLKSTDNYILYCDNCQSIIYRKVKDIRNSIKSNTNFIVCSRSCQTKLQNKRENGNCLYCGNTFTINFKGRKFCSRSCSCSYSSSNRKISDETKSKISRALTDRKISKVYELGDAVLTTYDYRTCKLPLSKIKTCKCKSCGFTGVYRNQKLYCDNCSHMYSESGRSKFIFTFNVYNYPDLFDLSIIDRHGWRKTKGLHKNVNGVSRDHRLSVSDAIKNNYDPYYIKHPLNCQLMLHSENQSKGSNSSITYEELIKSVDLYELNN